MDPTDPSPERVVIIDPAFIGDAVFDAALARALEARWPGVRVGLVLRPPAQALAAAMPHVDRVHVFDKRGKDRGWRGLERVAGQLAQERYDVAYIPHPSFRSSLLAARAQIPRRIGSAPGWLARWPLTERRAPNPADGLVAARLRLLSSTVADDPEAARLSGLLETSIRPPAAPLRIGLVLGSQWATKRWPVARAAELVAGLDPAAHRIVALGGPGEGALYDDLRTHLRGAGPAIEDMVGGSILELLDGLASCHAVVAGDTGPLHIARALGVPGIGLFGPTSEIGHVRGRLDRVLTVEIECRPCSVHGQRRCPKGHHRCLGDLTGDRVRGAVLDVLRDQRT